MGAFLVAKKRQKAWLEGDSGSEEKVKKVLRNIGVAGSKGPGPSSWAPHRRRPRPGSGGGP